MASDKQKSVMLILGWQLESITKGVIEYAKEHDWYLHIKRGPQLERSFRHWEGDGVISSVNIDYLKLLSKAKTHVVSLVHIVGGTKVKFRLVRENDYRIGQLAAEFFINSNFQNFAVYSELRYAGFRDTLQAHGFEPIRFEQTFEDFGMYKNKLQEWLKGLPKPCALFCENDWDAADLINAARFASIMVPQELSVLGVGNYELICHASNISISSIDTRLFEIGKLAAAELDKVMSGEIECSGEVFIDPEEIVIERQSTNFLAIEDPKLLAIIQYLKDNCHKPLNMESLARHFHLGSQSIYKLFIRKLNVSPKQFLLNLRLQKACDLLQGSDFILADIAERAGFPNSCALYTAFKEKYNTTPNEWRKNKK